MTRKKIGKSRLELRVCLVHAAMAALIVTLIVVSVPDVGNKKSCDSEPFEIEQTSEPLRGYTLEEMAEMEGVTSEELVQILEDMKYEKAKRQREYNERMLALTKDISECCDDDCDDHEHHHDD